MHLDIQSIITYSDLDKAIHFLHTNSLAKKITVDKLWEINKSISCSGLIVFDAFGEIVGAILYIYQGRILANKQLTNIVNLSSWYVLSEYRGLLPVMMIRSTLEKLKESYITNYTPTINVQKILLKFGFNYMPVKKYICLPIAFIVSNYYYFLFGKLKHIPIDYIVDKIPSLCRPIRSDCDTILFGFMIGCHTVYLGGSIDISEKYVLHKKIIIRSFSINWISDENIYAKYASQIAAKICIKLRVYFIIITVHESVKIQYTFKQLKSSYMVTSLPSVWIPPIGSELFI